MNKGFTLVELLSVIIVLMSLLLITSIVVNPVIDDSKDNLSDIQIKNIESSAKSYYIKEGIDSSHMDLDEARSCVTVDELINKGYLDKDEIVDPKSEESVLGSVKIIYRANNYSYEYQDKSCSNFDKGIICERVKETTIGNVPDGNYETGDKYICEVKPGFKYNFYIISKNNDETINLIMDRNICEDGKATEEGKTCLVLWATKEDYVKTKEDELEWNIVSNDYGNSNKGPITAMNYLYNATKDWVNIPNMVMNYEDENIDYDTHLKGTNGYGGIKTEDNITRITKKDSGIVKVLINQDGYVNLKARLPMYKEVHGEGKCSEGLGSCPLYLVNYLNNSESLKVEVLQNISGIDGYWLLSSYANFSNAAWYVNYHGFAGNNSISFDANYGARPVITLYKSQLE